MSSTKKTKSKLPNFFQCNLEDIMYLWRFDQLSSTISWQVTELQSYGNKVAHAGL